MFKSDREACSASAPFVRPSLSSTPPTKRSCHNTRPTVLPERWTYLSQLPHSDTAGYRPYCKLPSERLCTSDLDTHREASISALTYDMNACLMATSLLSDLPLASCLLLRVLSPLIPLPSVGPRLPPISVASSLCHPLSHILHSTSTDIPSAVSSVVPRLFHAHISSFNTTVSRSQ